MDGWAIARRIELTLGNVIRASLREPRTSIGIGGSLATPPLPHHRTYGTVYGGSAG